MSCETFERWLDEGMAPAAAESMLAHAHECARCARALDAARSLDHALCADAPPAPAPSADFTDAVMARLDPARAAMREPLRLPPMWVRLARDPALIAGALIAALVFAQRDSIAYVLKALAARANALAGPSAAAGATLADWLSTFTFRWELPGGEWIALGLVLGAVIPLSWWLYHVSQHWFDPRPRWR